MTTTARKLLGVALGIALAGVLIGFYIANYLVGDTPAFRATPVAAKQKTVDLVIQTVAAVGPQLAPTHPDWVSYLVRNDQGRWERSTVFTVPAFAAGVPDDPSTPRRLSLSRALAVRGILLGQGIASTAVLVRSQGASMPALGEGRASMDDINRLVAPDARKLEGAISGRALYDGRIDPAEALAVIRAARGVAA